MGKSCEKTNKVIDYPVKFLGRKHRILFHDPLSALIIGIAYDGVEGAVSGLLHIAVDKICSRYHVEKILDYLL
ncbi:MAG: hypothetical protein QXR09_00735 [Candidatus Aenigmatarchaeota archaeon]